MNYRFAPPLRYGKCAFTNLSERNFAVRKFGLKAQTRNPDDDLPSDFEVRRTTYYETLKHPLNSETFIANLQQEMRNALAMLDKGLPRNSAVKILTKDNKGQISLSPLAPQPEPVNLARLKAELMRRWPMTSLLDMLKETDLRKDVGFAVIFSISPSSLHH